MSTGHTLADLQAAFAGHIRNPSAVAAPAGIDDRRMQVYRDLFFNNINNLISKNFPVLRRLHDDDSWSRLLRDFYAEHRAHTPLFTELPKEFLRYLEERLQQRRGDPPFLLELAHYEWVEMALALDPRELAESNAEPNGDLISGIPLLSPLAWPLSYRFPVHRIGPEFQPAEPPSEATHLLVYRNRADQVKFIELNDVTRLLLALMSEEPTLCGRELLERIASRIGHPKPSRVFEHGARLMQELRARDVLLGIRRETGTA